MELDVNRFRTLIPINSLDEEHIRLLVKQTKVEHHARGTILFDIGDLDTDALFLLLGEIEICSEDGQTEIVQAGSHKGLHALASLKPRRYRGTICSDQAVFVRINSDLLDRVLTLMPSDVDPGAGMQVDEYERGPDAVDSEWMMAMLQSQTFLRLPASNIHALFQRMQELPVSAGQIILRQGEQGDYYYMIKRGSASVTRHSGATEAKLATLNPPQSFGEEALLTEEPRNATVTMLNDGVLMRLDKADFRSLLNEPLLHWVDIAGASQLMREGSVRVDVRTEAEFEESGLKSSLNLPLYLLRIKLPRLDKKRKYILYCDNGARSSTAGFLMSEKGFDVAVLKGGLSAVR